MLHAPFCILYSPFCILVLAALLASPLQAGPEDRRLDPAEFRKGLKERGLTELLEAYLNEVPPADPVENLVLERDIRLAEYADPARSPAERHRALLEANCLLERLLTEHSDDLRRFDWRMEWARALLYQEAEPYTSRILYRVGSAEDRRCLGEMMERAMQVLARLRLELAREFDRLEHVPQKEYAELENSGHVARVENYVPESDYLDRWVRFYRGLAREADDALRASELSAVLEDLRNRSGLLEKPHGETHIQAPLLLLAGLAARQVGDTVAAGTYLDKALTTVRRIDHETEREDLKWVTQLALLETVRVHCDDRRFDQAERALRDLAAYAETAGEAQSGLRLVLALTESRVRREQARQARAGGDPQATALDNMRFEPLMKLARQGAAQRDEIYAALYAQMDAQVSPADLHPFEGCALLGGLLSQATHLAAEGEAARAAGEPVLSAKLEELAARRLAALDRAILVAQHFREAAARVPPELLPEIVYNQGVAYLQRGHRREAARAFLSVARDHRSFPQAQLAATAAVQVVSELAEDPSLRDRAEIQALYLEALQVLTTNFAPGADARYWQFFLAQLLHDLGRYDEAAEAFAQVEAAHEYSLQAAFLRIRSLASALRECAADPQAQPVGSARRAAAIVEAAEAFLERVGTTGGKGVDAAVPADLLAEAELFAAEALLHQGKKSSSGVLTRLDGFEQRYPGQNRLMGRVLRARIMAYEHLGRLEQAESTLPEYIRRDPDGAGATLQALFESIREDIERLRERERGMEAERKVESALVLARQIHEWAAADPSRVRPDQEYAIDLQLAQALLQAKRYEEAEPVFAACLAREGSGGVASAGDLRAVRGRAETLYHLGRYADALPLFHRLYQSASPGEPTWFHALLRDLQCRTQLGHPPEGIIQVIRQQKFLHDDLGGPDLRRQFEDLLRRNEERLKGLGK